MLGSFILLFPILNQSAHALSCLEGVYQSVPDKTQGFLPSNGEILVWSSWIDPSIETLLLVDITNSVPIPIEIIHVQEMLFKVVPNEQLIEDHTYQLSTSWSGSAEDQWVHSTFIVDYQADNTVPSAPIIVTHEREYGNSEWGDWDNRQFTIDADLDTAYYKIEVADNPNFENSTFIWEKENQGQISIGYDACHSNISSDTLENMTHIRVQAYDLAGNPSEWSSPLNIDEAHAFPFECGVGCSSLPAQRSSIIMLMCAGFIGFRRRQTK